MKPLFILLAVALSGCIASNRYYGLPVMTKDGKATVPIRYSQQADVVGDFKLVIRPDGSIEHYITTPKNPTIIRVPLVDSRGRVQLNKSGEPVYTEVAVVASSISSKVTQDYLNALLKDGVSSIASSVAGAMTGTAVAVETGRILTR